jgi:hypothetical protein
VEPSQTRRHCRTQLPTASSSTRRLGCRPTRSAATTAPDDLPAPRRPSGPSRTETSVITWRMGEAASTYRLELEELEAYLVEHELSARLAPTVAGLIDVGGWSLERAVAEMRLTVRP